jgi:hypothetical protein
MAAVLTPASVALATPGAGPHGTVLRSRGVAAAVTATGASLSNGRVSRSWAFGADRSVTTTRLEGAGGHNWAASGADFQLDLDGVPTSSTTGWALQSATLVSPPALPNRTDSDKGAALLFRYALASAALPAGVELDRLVVLHPGAGVLETRSTLLDHAPVPLRVTSYSLDQVTAADPALPAEVQAYNNGSDWRDDYRHVSAPTGEFDAEGEVVRLGADAGFFLVSQRRGGAMSRVGRDATGRSWVGVDWARDAFDYGPLQDTPPDYNRLENPAYPVPVRARVVPPLGSLDLGTSFVGVYAGGAAEAAATFAADFAVAVAPAYPHTVGINTFHPWSHGTGMSDPNLRAQVEAVAALGGQTLMLDDQWQGGAGGESGDWRFDPARFPDDDNDGVPDFVTYLHSKDVQLGLWMSPLEFNSASTTYAAHPDWACAPVGDLTAQVPDDAGLGVWDVNNEAFRSYLLGVINRLVAAYDVKEFKFDFLTWVDCPPHDYADYEDGFVSLVREMQQAHPTVTFETDETNDQRSWPFESAALGPSWFDNAHLHGSTAVAKLLHDVWSAAPWVPTASLGVGAFDGTLTGPYAGVAGVDALFPLAMLTHLTFWTDLTTLSPEQRGETAWWVSWYRAHAADLGSVVYELTTADPLDGTSWAAWEPWRDDHGYLFAFRQAGGPDTATLSLRGVDPATTYSVSDVRTGASLGTFTGAQLQSGLPVSLAANSSQVLSVAPVG